MAHIFYADKHPLTNDESQASWSSQVKYVFKFMEWWNRYRIFNLFPAKSLFWLNAIGNIAGKIALKSRKSYQRNIIESYRALYPKYASTKFEKRFRKAHSAYLGKLMFAFMAGLTVRTPPPSTEFARYQNLNLLDRELSKKKGVIIPLTHLGELTQAIWALSKHPKKYIIATVVYVPHMGIYKYANHPYYDNAFFYASTSFRKIAKYLENHLRQNHIVMIYYDFGHPGQFRVPFWYTKFPYLINTPQSPIKLHKNTEASILPCINLPDKKIGKTLMKFIENKSLMELSAQYWDESSNKFHGVLSTELNKIYAPYLRAYAHVWEQVTDFGTKRSSDKLEFPPYQNLKAILELSIQKMYEIIGQSFEPNRDDDTIRKNIGSLSTELFSLLDNPALEFRSHKTFIVLSKMTAVSEIQKICNILIKEYKKFKEEKVVILLSQFHREMKKYQTFPVSVVKNHFDF
jgi:lauroyl/myristoyl acyltransferase